jgi:O-antigen ligase
VTSEVLDSPSILFFGVGLGKGSNPHNFLLHYLWGTGVIGLAILLYFLSLCYVPLRAPPYAQSGAGLLDGARLGRYLLVSIAVNGVLGGFLVLMAAAMTAMVMIGCFVEPARRRPGRAPPPTSQPTS